MSLYPDPYETLVPPGEYTVGFTGEEKYAFHGRNCWRCRWQILGDGDYSGLLLYSWFNLPEPDAPIRPSHAIYSAYVVATGLRPPKDLAQHRPGWFLGDCQFRAKVRTVNRDPNGVKRPDAASYSRVAFLIERLEGTPTCLLRREGE